jgi:hypothetical protein
MSVFIIPGFYSQKKTYQLLLERVRASGLTVEIVELGLNIRNLKHNAQVVLKYLERTTEQDDIIAHSFGGLILKQILITKPDIVHQIRSISFVAVPHQGSWAALTVPVWPASFDMMPFSKALKETTKAVLPKRVKNFLPSTELKIWPKSSSALHDSLDVVIPGVNHDSIIDSPVFAEQVISFIKSDC